MRIKQLGIAALLAFALPVTSSAAIVFVDSYSDSLTVGSPSFNRPIANNNSAPTTLSGVGTNAFYDAFDFTVAITGDYYWQSTQSFDGYLILYAGGFNPAAPLTNAVIANDDSDATCSGGPGVIGFSCLPGGPSGVLLTLNSGVNYTLVTAAFGNGIVGDFTNTLYFDDPSEVPEPSTMLLMSAGLGGLLLWRRKRHAA